jgi:hypothetical protein
MINLFDRPSAGPASALRNFNEANLPTDGALPDVHTGEHAVLGKDANLPLIVRELAPMQLENLRRERDRLQKRLNEINEYEQTLLALLDVVK